MLTARKFELVIFDDLDFALSTRSAGDNGFVNNLLSYSDGIFGSSSKILITTNIALKEIDSALLRPGRCFDFLELNPLKAEDARFIWTNILNMEPALMNNAWCSMDHVTQADLMSHYYRILSNSKERTYIKNGPRVYSVEDKINKMLEGQKAGFNA